MINSAVEKLFETRVKEQRTALKAVLASQFMAAIPENPNIDNLDNLFARSTFISYRTGSDVQARKILTEIKNSLEDET